MKEVDRLLLAELPDFIERHWPKQEKGTPGRGDATIAITLFCTEILPRFISEVRRDELKWLETHGSGGGNWRRLLIVRLAELTKEAKK